MTAPIVPGSIGDLFWQVAEAVLLLDAGVVTAWNPAAERLLGPRPPVGTRVEVALAPPLGPAYDELRPLLETPGSAEIDATKTCGLVLESMTWRLGDTGTWVLVLRDVTAQRRLAGGLARLSALGRELVDREPSVPELLQRTADEAKALSGAAFTAVILIRPGHPEEVSHFVYNAPRERFPDRLPRAVGLLGVPIQTRAPARIDDIRGHSAGVGIPVEHPPIGPLLAVPILGGDEVIGEIAIANPPEDRPFGDVDEQLLVELSAHTGTALRWAQMRERARADAELRREVIATARHDIRNPLTIGQGYISLVERRRGQMSEAQLASAIAAIRTAFDRIDAFASRAFIDDDQLLPGTAPEWAAIGVRDFAEQLGTDHNVDAGGQPVLVVIESDVPPTFAGDEGMVRQVLDNLISNARKYGAEDSDITVTARREGEQVRFDVHNLGAGISIEEQGKLFDPYFRTETARADGVPGTGLGLAIVRRLVELHGGVLGVSSRLDEGTTFWVTFPSDVPLSSSGDD